MNARFEAITLDFGNTLVPFSAGSMADVVRLTAERSAGLVGSTADEFAHVWGEERLRQFAEDVPVNTDRALLSSTVFNRAGRGKPRPVLFLALRSGASGARSFQAK